MTTTDPTQAQKFFWLGLSRSLQSVSDDDVPADAVSINSFTIDSVTEDPLGFGTDITFSYELENTTTTALTSTTTLTSNLTSSEKQSYEFSSGEIITDTVTINTIFSGEFTFTLSIGNQTAQETTRISYF